MVLEANSANPTRRHEDPWTNDLYSAACFLKDQLEKVEGRCKISCEKGIALKQKRQELLEFLKFLQIVEQSEKNTTHDLERNLATSSGDAAQGDRASISPTCSTDIAFCEDSAASSNPYSATLPSHGGWSFYRPGAFFQDSNSTNSESPIASAILNGATCSAGPSGLSSGPRNVFPDFWKHITTSFAPDVKEGSHRKPNIQQGSGVRDNVATAAATSGKKDSQRVLQLVTALKVNLGNQIRSTKRRRPQGTLGFEKYKNWKTMPHKALRQSRKSYAPIATGSSRLAPQPRTSQRVVNQAKILRGTWSSAKSFNPSPTVFNTVPFGMDAPDEFGLTVGQTSTDAPTA